MRSAFRASEGVGNVVCRRGCVVGGTVRGFLVAVMLPRSGYQLQGCVHFVNVYNACILHIHKKLKSICPPDFEGKITQSTKKMHTGYSIPTGPGVPISQGVYLQG